MRTGMPAAARWAIYVGVAIVFAIVCAVLSNWQFGRNAWRSDQLALVSENYDAAAVPIPEVIPVGASFPAGAEWKPVALHGTYLPEGQLLVRNRVHAGTSAYEVLVPFRLDDGRVVLVDRGWLPPSDEHAQSVPVPAPPAGEATVVVRLRPGESLPTSGRSAPEGQVPTINLPLIAETLGPIGSTMLTDVYGQMASEDPAPAATPGGFDVPSIDPGPYLSYAVQWILFAIMGFVFIGYIIRTEIRAKKEEAEEDGGAAKRASREAARRRRRDRDAADEDALIDA